MSAPSMKKRRRRNMMSIMGMRFGFEYSEIPPLFLAMRCLLQINGLSGVAGFLLGFRRQVPRQDLADLVVDAQHDVGHLVLHEEEGRQEHDGDEQAHRR